MVGGEKIIIGTAVSLRAAVLSGNQENEDAAKTHQQDIRHGHMRTHNDNRFV